MAASTLKCVLITDAANSLGRELSTICAKNGHNLILVSKSEEELEKISKDLSKKYAVFIYPLAYDSSKTDSALNIFDELKKEGLCVDILINNASAGMLGMFGEISMKDDLAMLNTNIYFFMQMTKFFLDQLGDRRGKILNISSLTSLFPGPLISVYNASKAFVLSFSESLDAEVRDRDVTVSVLCHVPEKLHFVKTIAKFKWLPMKSSAKSVAETAYIGMMNGKKIIIPGNLEIVKHISTRVIPYGMLSEIMKKIRLSSREYRVGLPFSA